MNGPTAESAGAARRGQSRHTTSTQTFDGEVAVGEGLACDPPEVGPSAGAEVCCPVGAVRLLAGVSEPEDCEAVCGCGDDVAVG